ncbi:ethanolamine ammonia-lyase subunit EutC [Nocardia sp. NPDC057353]|uniref:ethanolamine ammonia-lyase subunit EutC n=1 Tax=Nocardia sp. NPDC057353 TaxID=3346104 RepID=UPI0036433A12
MSAPDFWAALRGSTRARIGLGRAGDALPTERVLEFRAAHSVARDAVHAALDTDAVTADLAARGLGEAAVVTSRARDRAEYLRRPDLGRLPGSELPGSGDENGSYDVGFVLADGLSAFAVAEHGPATLEALAKRLPPALTVAPPVVATQARVALGDHIGAALGVTTLVLLIGERPGLSTADSLGIYLTHHPRPGRTDAERNCLSNIHPPDGLGYDRAAQITAALIEGARALGRSGVDLKDDSLPLDAADRAELG